jgi:hypothetical protein
MYDQHHRSPHNFGHVELKAQPKVDRTGTEHERVCARPTTINKGLTHALILVGNLEDHNICIP